MKRDEPRFPRAKGVTVMRVQIIPATGELVVSMPETKRVLKEIERMKQERANRR
jgi:hypothetical protein